MYKKKKMFIFACLCFFQASASFANSIDYLNNQSSDYFRNFNRNAAIDAADIVHFNPAGTAFMKEGMQVKFDLQYLNKDYGMKYEGTDYHSTEPSYIPTFFSVYKNSDWSAFCAFTVPAGGGTLEYTDGIPALKDYAPVVSNDFTGTSVYGALTGGGAYSFTNRLSMSLGVRYVYVYKKYESSGPNYDLDVKKTAKGAGLIAGIDWIISDLVMVAGRIESPTKLEFTRETETDYIVFQMMFPDGEKEREDLPATAALGVNFRPAKNLVIGTSLTVYLNKTGKNETYDENGYGNGFDLGIGADYNVNSRLLVGCGYQYAVTGGADDVTYLAYALNSHCLAAGVKFAFSEALKAGISSSYIMYQDEKGLVSQTGEGTYHKSIISLNLGLEYSL